MFEASDICESIDTNMIERMAESLATLTGRLYIVGLGGSMANAIHMAADMRKLCNIDAEAVANIAEITARMNDEGPHTIFDGLGLDPNDALFILSVGGGTENVSRSISRAVDQAKDRGATVLGIVGPNGGHTAERADIVIRVPVHNPKHVTPHTEAFQAVIWHCLVSHPLLQKRSTKW